MNQNEVNTVLLKFVKQEFAGHSKVAIDFDDDLFASGIIDSLGVMRLIRFIETTYRCSVPMEDILPENFSSIQRISDYLTNQ